MFCPNCGTKFDEGTRFCINCGTKLPEAPAAVNPAPAKASAPVPAEAPVAADIPMTAPDTTTDTSAAPCNVAAEPQQPVHGEALKNVSEKAIIVADAINKKTGKKKGNKKLLVILICVFAAICFLASLAFFLWKPVLSAVSPKNYLKLVINDTFKSVKKDVSKVQNNLFGFEIGPDKPFTLSFDTSYESDYYDYSEQNTFTISNNPSKKEVTFSYLDYDDEYASFINDKEMGISTPHTGTTYLTIPTKGFGQKLKKDDGYFADTVRDSTSEEMWDFLCEFDTSYSNLMKILQGNDKATKAIVNIVSDEFGELLDEGNLSKKKVNYIFDDSKVTATAYTVTVDSDDIEEFFIDTLDEISINKDVEKLLGKNTMRMLRDMSDHVARNINLPDNQNVEFVFVVYNHKLVKVEVILDAKDYHHSTSISATKKDNYLNGINLTVATSQENYYTDVSEYILDANWVTEDENVSVIVSKNVEYSFDNDTPKGYSTAYGINFDFPKNTWKVKASKAYLHDGKKDDDSENNYYITGSCSRKNGFKFNFTNEYTETYYDGYYSMDYDEWLEEKYDQNSYSFLRDTYYDSTWYYFGESYSEWYNDIGYLYDHYYDSDFEEWIEDVEGVSDIYELYDEEAYCEETVYENISEKMNFTLTDKSDAGTKKRKTLNLFDTDEDQLRKYF